MHVQIEEWYSCDMLRNSAQTYVDQRTIVWLGVRWYTPSTQVCLAWDDETLYHVSDLLACGKQKAEHLLRLLLVSGTHMVCGSVVRHPRYDDEEMEDGYQALQDAYRYQMVLTGKGLRRWTQVQYRVGRSIVHVPVHDEPVHVDRVVQVARRHGVGLTQLRFVLNLRIYYLVARAGAVVCV